jgi:hypothetical protein
MKLKDLCYLDAGLNIKGTKSLVLVAHTCNPSYLWGRDQEDHGLKWTWANRPYLKKKPSQKGLMEWLKVLALSSNTSAAKINKEIIKVE